MTRNTRTICSLLLCAAFAAISAPAYAQKDFDREAAAKSIAESNPFQDCRTDINNGDTCNWAIFTGRWNLIAERWGSAAAHPQPDDLKGNAVGYWLYKDKSYLR